MFNPDYLPYHAGFATFLRSPVAAVEDLRPGMVAVLGVPQDFTCGSRPGTRFGPRGIRESSLHLNYYIQTSPTREMVHVITGERIRVPKDRRLVDLGDVVLYPTEPARSGTSVSESVTTVLDAGAFPVILGGDHYITYPAFVGFRDALVKQGKHRLGYIQLDAHLDLAEENPLFGTFSHGANARHISRLPEVDPRNMVWVGTRGFTRVEQWDFVKQSGATAFTMESVRHEGIGPVVERALEIAGRNTDAVYLSVDIDVVDVIYAPGTGALAFGGITPADLFAAMEILRGGPIGAFDLVEVTPALDPTGVTERMAANAILTFLTPRIYEH